MGALASAFMLGIVLPLLGTGMPELVLRALALAAVVFSVYSISCFVLRKGGRWLKLIALANALYCVVTFGLLISFFDDVTWPGRAYFVGEILIIAALVAVEVRHAQALPEGARPG